MKGAEPLALYGDGHYRGRPAASLHRLGAGQVIYLGAAADQPLVDALLRWLCDAADVKPALDTPPGVEATVREGNGRRLLFLLNHGSRSRTVTLGRSNSRELLAGSPAGRRITLPPKTVRVLMSTLPTVGTPPGPREDRAPLLEPQ